MKKQISILALSLMIAASSAFAAEGKGEGPCKKLRTACEAAGFQKGMHKKNGKGLWIDCMNQLKAGKSVEGVNVDQADVNACNEKAAERKAHKAANKS